MLDIPDTVLPGVLLFVPSGPWEFELDRPDAGSWELVDMYWDIVAVDMLPDACSLELCGLGEGSALDVLLRLCADEAGDGALVVEERLELVPVDAP